MITQYGLWKIYLLLECCSALCTSYSLRDLVEMSASLILSIRVSWTQSPRLTLIGHLVTLQAWLHSCFLLGIFQQACETGFILVPTLQRWQLRFEAENQIPPVIHWLPGSRTRIKKSSSGPVLSVLGLVVK